MTLSFNIQPFVDMFRKNHICYEFSIPAHLKEFSQKKTTSRSDLCGAYPIGLHRTGIYSPILILLDQPTGGKYTSSMDPYGYWNSDVQISKSSVVGSQQIP